MKSYNRIMAGKQSIHAGKCFAEGFIGVDYDFDLNLTGHLPENWKAFSKEFIPYLLQRSPDKSRIAAGLACGFTWTLSKGLQEGDVVITPDGMGRYRSGEIVGPYQYAPGQPLPHRRPVQWSGETFARADMSEPLQRSTNSTGTCCDITKYAAELETLIGGHTPPALVAADPAVEDPTVFALEKHLEDFLVSNWKFTELGKSHDIFAVDGELVGQQFPTDTGPIDVLAVSKDGKELLVVELKRGRASDVVVGQIQRYMGYVKDELAEADQMVRGVIIALEDDLRLRRALSVAPSISFYRYKVSFTLLAVPT